MIPFIFFIQGYREVRGTLSFDATSVAVYGLPVSVLFIGWIGSHLAGPLGV